MDTAGNHFPYVNRDRSATTQKKSCEERARRGGHFVVSQSHRAPEARLDVSLAAIAEFEAHIRIMRTWISPPCVQSPLACRSKISKRNIPALSRKPLHISESPPQILISVQYRTSRILSWPWRARSSWRRAAPFSKDAVGRCPSHRSGTRAPAPFGRCFRTFSPRLSCSVSGTPVSVCRENL